MSKDMQHTPYPEVVEAAQKILTSARKELMFYGRGYFDMEGVRQSPPGRIALRDSPSLRISMYEGTPAETLARWIQALPARIEVGKGFIMATPMLNGELLARQCDFI